MRRGGSEKNRRTPRRAEHRAPTGWRNLSCACQRPLLRWRVSFDRMSRSRARLAGVMVLFLSPGSAWAQAPPTVTFLPDAEKASAPRVSSPSRDGKAFELGPSGGATVSRLLLRRIELRENTFSRALEQSVAQQGAHHDGPLWHAALWGVVGGVSGFFSGAFVGDHIDKHFHPNEGDPGFKGAVIGSITGAILGAFLLARFGP